MKNNTMNICFTINDPYALYLSTAMLSILKNSAPDDEFRFFVLNAGDVSAENKRKIGRLKEVKDFAIEWVDVDKTPFLNLAGGCHYTTNFRLKVCSLLPQLDRLLFLDTDIIALDSLAELYNTDLGDYLAAGVLDPCPQKERDILGHDFDDVELFNTGVLLIDAAAWRKNDIENKLFKTLEWFSTLPVQRWPDQSSINYLLNGKIKKMSPRYNACPLLAYDAHVIEHGYYYEDEKRRDEAFANPVILHYCAGFFRLPTSTLRNNAPYADYYWEYMKESPFFNEFLEREIRIEALSFSKTRKRKKYPKWLGNIICCFIPSRKKRQRFREHHIK